MSWSVSGWKLAAWMMVALPVAGAQLPESPEPVKVRDSLAEASRLIAAGNYKRAEEALRGYLAADAAAGRARYMLGYVLLRQNRPAESLAEYTRGASLEPPTAEAFRNVAQDYVLLGDYPDADTWMLRSVAMNRADPDGWYGLGRLRSTEQRYVEAVNCFKRALALAPGSVKAENNLGLAYEGLNRTEDAVAAYRQAIAWQDAGPPEKRSEQPMLNLATMLLHGGETGEALPLLRQALAIAPGEARVLEQMGQAYLQQGEYASAADALEAAVRADPARSNLHFLLGQAYRHLGRQKEAKEALDAAARLAAPSAP